MKEKLKTNQILMLLLTAFACHSSSVSAQDLSLSTSVFSDLVHDGISLSNEEPGIALDLDLSYTNGVFLGARLSFHEKTGRASRNGINHFYLGYFSEVNQHNAISVSLSHYDFNADFPRSWNYSELRTDYFLTREVSLGLVFADSYYGFDSNSVKTEIQWQPELYEDLYGVVKITNTDVSENTLFDKTSSIELGIVQNLDRLSISASFIYADDDAYLIHREENLGNRAVLKLTYQIY